MEADLAVLPAEGPRVSGTAAETAAARYSAAAAAAATGVEPLLQEVQLPTGTASANVWAPVLGSGEVSLLIGAHLDSWAGSPGADDNGSGVSWSSNCCAGSPITLPDRSGSR